MGPEFGRQICKVILVPPALHRDFQSTVQLVPVTHSVHLKCTVSIPGTWTATGEWAMKAKAAPRGFGGGGASGSDWLLLRG